MIPVQIFGKMSLISNMEPQYDHNKYERKIYSLWEDSDSFVPSSSGEPFTILMPPPNANASLHAGHAMYTVDDVMVRYKRMQGFSAVWIPGRDHAGFETQFVYEKQLAKEGKSRMDFDRVTLYKNIYDFVTNNSGLIFEQFKRLGFSADWKRSVFTLDDHVVDRAFDTFKKMESENYVYRDDYIVNYCVHCGTSLAELEVKHIEREDSLYFIKYQMKDEKSHIIIATTRPETIYIDTHIAVNPKDKKTKQLIGQKVINPLSGIEMEIIGDEFVDPEFGTGIVKLTPAHDQNDYLVAKKNNLPIVSYIDWNGKIKENGGVYSGLKVKVAREMVVKDLDSKKMIDHIDEHYNHSVISCYKCGRDLEPMTIPNWFIKVKDLKEKVKEVIEEDKIKFYPKKFKKHMLSWLDIMHDWPISRQIVWGIRIPVWYEVDTTASNIWVWWIDDKKKLQWGGLNQFLEKGITVDEIEKGLQKVYTLAGASGPKYIVSKEKPKDGKEYLPETDTFDTWFSSGQWPLVTLNKDEFKNRFPTNMMGTLSDILKFWVSRMIMFSIYLKNEIPFKDVYLWSMVADSKGVKMSKSKGNVINPLDLVDKYGADALRMSLMYGIPAGSKVILADQKVKGMRNFSNKIWNIARFVTTYEGGKTETPKSNEDDLWILKELEETIKGVSVALDKYRLNEASEKIYDFIWHKFADIYIEKSKNRRAESQLILERVLKDSLKLLHPFMPFVTEAIWQENKIIFGDQNLIISPWPK
ncbi:MAG: hypothetical protein ACD_19C00176G0022 [uncultured bacterium]|nr:MAG: hypothetical protein ACD_19C00176G0022 [uncultured bacterium]